MPRVFKGMKRVTQDVAKVVYEAGFPMMFWQTVSRAQFEAGHLYKLSEDKNYFSVCPSERYPDDNDTLDVYYCPTYIEVWLWLWRDKKACIGILFDEGDCNVEIWQEGKDYVRDLENKFDPEEAIIAAIEYLVNNDLLK